MATKEVPLIEAASSSMEQNSSTDQAKVTGFQDLSAELRNSVYWLAVEDVPVGDGYYRINNGLPSFTRLNRQTRGECLAMFFANTDFLVVIEEKDKIGEGSFQKLIDWLNGLGTHNVGQIKSFSIICHTEFDFMASERETRDVITTFEVFALKTRMSGLRPCQTHFLDRPTKRSADDYAVLTNAIFKYLILGRIFKDYGIAIPQSLAEEQRVREEEELDGARYYSTTGRSRASPLRSVCHWEIVYREIENSMAREEYDERMRLGLGQERVPEKLQ